MPLLLRLLRALRAFLGSPALLFFAWGLMAFAIFAVGYWMKGPARAGIPLFSSLGLRMLAANSHWMLALVPHTAVTFALLMGYAFKPFKDKRAALRSAGLALLLTTLGAGALFLHGNYVLPKANAEAGRLRLEAKGIKGADSSLTASRRGVRELSIREMRTSIARNRQDIAKLEALGSTLAEGETIANKKKRWIAQLEWEIAKKIQMPLWLPFLAVFTLSLGFLLRAVGNGVLRFLIAWVLGKYPFKFLFKGFIALEARQMVPGASPLHAYAPLALLAAVSLALGALVWFLFLRGNPSDPVIGDEPES